LTRKLTARSKKSPALALAFLAFLVFLLCSAWTDIAFPADAGKTQDCPRKNTSWPAAATFIGGAIAVFVLANYFNGRKNRKAIKQFQALLQTVEPGDGVVTSGGAFAKVLSVDDRTLILAFEEGGKARVIKESVVSIVKLADNRPELDMTPGLRRYFPKNGEKP
jgi:preprotein translocase YajC subunit